ncbi:hypothetical protein AOQ84DRAFT_223066 [Glonium stellatum]|uniref:Uncharacterized protein n=1 Tax=Glonium stellatum TaxID=574774 RepID=A0A8E2EYS4_9PEZI|nr:hypothetical protein AOQ84DRAFT_223066 [Glonium stellatum]
MLDAAIQPFSTLALSYGSDFAVVKWQMLCNDYGVSMKLDARDEGGARIWKPADSVENRATAANNRSTEPCELANAYIA